MRIQEKDIYSATKAIKKFRIELLFEIFQEGI